MLMFLLVAGVVAGFVFPSFLIRAIRAKEEVDSAIYRGLACASFGIAVTAILVLTAFA